MIQLIGTVHRVMRNIDGTRIDCGMSNTIMPAFLSAVSGWLVDPSSDVAPTHIILSTEDDEILGTETEVGGTIIYAKEVGSVTAGTEANSAQYTTEFATTDSPIYS